MHELGETRETMRIFCSDQFPLRVGPRSATSAEYAAAQQHAERSEPIPRPCEVRRSHRVVGVELVEDRMRAISLVKQMLQRAGVNTPGFFRYVT